MKNIIIAISLSLIYGLIMYKVLDSFYWHIYKAGYNAGSEQMMYSTDIDRVFEFVKTCNPNPPSYAAIAFERAIDRTKPYSSDYQYPGFNMEKLQFGCADLKKFYSSYK